MGEGGLTEQIEEGYLNERDRRAINNPKINSKSILFDLVIYGQNGFVFLPVLYS